MDADAVRRSCKLDFDWKGQACQRVMGLNCGELSIFIWDSYAWDDCILDSGTMWCEQVYRASGTMQC